MLPEKVYLTVSNAIDTATNEMLAHRAEMETEDVLIYKRLHSITRKIVQRVKKAHALRLKAKTSGSAKP